MLLSDSFHAAQRQFGQFIRPNCSAAEIRALKDVLPKNCISSLSWEIKKDTSEFVNRNYMFRSPNPSFPIQDILSAAQILKQSNRITLRAALQKILTEDNESIAALVLAKMSQK